MARPKQLSGDFVFCAFCNQQIKFDRGQQSKVLKLKNGGVAEVHLNRPGTDCVKGYKKKYPGQIDCDDATSDNTDLCEHAMAVQGQRQVPRVGNTRERVWTAIPNAPERDLAASGGGKHR